MWKGTPGWGLPLLLTWVQGETFISLNSCCKIFLHCKVWWLGFARFQVFNSTMML
jgi:hypothetical protein